MTDGARNHSQLDLDGALSRIRTLDAERRELSDQIDQLRRELRCAKAEAQLKEEFASSLEASLDSKLAYIGSLRSIRLKAWLLGVIGRIKR